MKSLIPWAAALALALPVSAAQAQAPAAAFPGKPVRIIVPFAAGGATDVIARTVGQKLSEQWGQPVLIDNRAGGNGNIGAAAAAKAPADGYTLLMATSSHAINATLYKRLDYSLSRDFAALSNLAAVPLVLVAHPGVPVTSPRQLASYANERAGTLNFGSGGIGTAAHLAGELFNTASGARMAHVSYKGGAPAMNDLLGGQIQVMFANLPEALAHVRAGKLRALAVTGATRHVQQPDVPTFAETGFKGIEARSWFGLFVPQGTPKPVIDKLGRDIAAAVADAQVQARLKDLGAEPVGNQPAQFQAYVDSEIQRWGALVQQSGATSD
ncbi:MAG TPA: tripartite tricarboxylate transporter substrate binding protein [Ramlibacter sp.]|nr:tripartite tricarboxylate transporter substrate binding protein [Ramlibacter sp.]